MTLALYNDALDDMPYKEEEGAFLRLNNTLSPVNLPPGTVTEARNCWMDSDGVVHTRPGLREVSDLQAALGVFEVEGMGYFDTPTKEALLMVFGSSIYEINADTAPQTPTLVGTGVATFGGYSHFAQLIDRMFVTAQDTPGFYFVYWNGSAWSNGTVTTFSNTNAMPKWQTVVAHQFRLFAAERGTNRIYVSAILNAETPANWDALQNVVVGNGAGDPTRVLISGQDANLIVLNESSCWMVDTGDLNAANWNIRKLTDVAGCVARKAAALVGQEVYFLSRYGLVTLSGLVTSDTISAASTISYPVQRTIDRINWAVVDDDYNGAKITTWRNLLLLWVPIDGALIANRILVYNTVTREWVGEWSGADGAQAVQMATGVVTRFGGVRETLVAGYNGQILRLDETYANDDLPRTAPKNIVSWVKTRALAYGMHEAMKQPFWLEVELDRSQSQSLSVAFVPDDEVTYPQIALPTSRLVLSGISGGLFLTLPFTLPFTFIANFTRRIRAHIRNQPRFREAQFIVHSANGEIGLRKLRTASFLDTPQII